VQKKVAVNKYPGASLLFEIDVAQLLALGLPDRDHLVVLSQFTPSEIAHALARNLVVVEVQFWEVAVIIQRFVAHPQLIPLVGLRQLPRHRVGIHPLLHGCHQQLRLVQLVEHK
jgi:hypothetical protein